MMLCEAKRDAIIQWHNAFSTSNNNISSLKQLQDGSILQNHIKEINQETPERAVATSHKNINFFKEADSRASFSYVRKHLDTFCHTETEKLLSYEGCMAGEELQIAKLSVVTLCYTVAQLRLRVEDTRMGLLCQLDMLTQREIQECIFFVMSDDTRELARDDFDRILSRSVTIKEKLVRVSGECCSGSVTPRLRGRPRKYVDYETSFSEDGSDGPGLVQAFESPVIRCYAGRYYNRRRTEELRENLEVAENRIIDLRMMLEQARNDRFKDGEEIQQLKEKLRTLQEAHDSLQFSTDSRIQSMEAQIQSSERNSSDTSKALESENAALKKEVETLRDISDDLTSKLKRYREKEPRMRERLAEYESQLQLSSSEKESLAAEAERLREELKEMRDAVSVYKDKLEEKDKEFGSRLMEYSNPEIVGDIIEEDNKATREKLLSEEVQNATLRRLLEEKTALCEKQQAQLKILESVPSSGKLWADYEGESGSESEDGGNGPAATSQTTMEEIVRLAERALAAHGEGSMPELPGGAENAERAKRLLGALLERPRAHGAKGEGFETKSDEVSLDSGMCAASDPGSLPSSGEEETRRPDPFEPPAENLRDLYEGALRAKEECERRNEELNSEVDRLTESTEKLSLELESSRRKIAESDAQRKRCLGKYAKLKEYVLEIEGKLENADRKWRLCKEEVREQALRSRATERDLRSAAARLRESRDGLSRELDLLQHRNGQLERQNADLQTELEQERAKCKQLTLENTDLRRRRDWGCEVEYGGNEAAAAGPSYIKMKVYPAGKGEEALPSKGNESVLSGNPFNMSLHSTLIAEDEDLFVHHTQLPPMEGEMDSFSEQRRMEELKVRNSLYMPHLRSAYLLETQGYRKGSEGVEEGEEPPKKQVVKPGPEASTSGETPRPKRFSGIFKTPFRTPRGLHRLAQRREEERKKKLGIKRPRLKY